MEIWVSVGRTKSNALQWGQRWSGLYEGKHFYPSCQARKSSASTAVVGSVKQKVPGEPGQGWAAWCHLSMSLPPALLLPGH